MKRQLSKFFLFVSAIILMSFTTGPAVAGGLVEMDFNPDNFSDPLTIDNTYWPLVAGTVFTYFAETEDGCEWNRVEVSYGDKDVDEVTTRVVLDREWIDESEDCADKYDQYPTDFPDGYGELAEITHDWYAQDDDGNIWYLGEHTLSLDADEEECEDWTEDDELFEEAGCRDGSFESGVDDAEAGIIMLADPSNGDFYQQEFDEDNAEDWAKVLNFITLDDSEECLKTKEWTPLERGAIEHKYYCPEEGLLMIEEVSGGPTVWVELIDVYHN